MTDLRYPTMDLARQRARKLREFYGHLVIYVSVCVLLVSIDLVTGSSGATFMGLDWAYWPILGWGIAVAIHGLSLASPSQRGWEERKAEELYEKGRQRELEHH